MESQPNRRWIAIALLAALAAAPAALLISRGGGSDENPSSRAAVENADGCRAVAAPAAKSASFSSPERVLQPGEEATAVVKTNCGTFAIALDAKRAPKTANSFAFLAERGFYDDLTFHRIAPGFVIQGGDPQGTGTGGPGYSVDEQPPQNLSYTRGVVAMAKSEVEPPGRSGSQFFIVTAPDAGLPPAYALVGRVSEGYDVVARIERLGTSEETPRRTVLIEDVTIERGQRG